MDIVIILRLTILLSTLILTHGQNSSPLLLYTHEYLDRQNYFRCVSDSNNTSKATSIVLQKYQTVSGIRKYYVPDKSSSALNCDFEKGFCNYNANQWIRLNNLQYIPFLINDERWEDLEEILLEDSFTYTGIELNETRSFSFSVRAEYGVHIIICDKKRIIEGETSCYWLIIDGGGRSTPFRALRKCKKNIIPKGYPPQKCAEYFEKEEKVTLKKTVWNSLTINLRKHGEKLYVSIVSYPNRKIFEYIDKEDLLDVKYVLAKTPDNEKSVWKFHKTHYLLTTEKNAVLKITTLHQSQNELCISLFVLLCSSCGISINIYHEGSIRHSYALRPKKDMEWYRETVLIENNFYFENITVEFVSFLQSYNSYQIWGIDNIRECTGNEIKIIETSNSAGENSKCQFVEDSSYAEISLDRKSYHCSSGHFGSTCSGRCSDIMGRDFELCNNTIICSEYQCYCPPGFNGKYCKKECKMYDKETPCDFSCHSNCNVCNYFNKTCDECIVGFEFPICHQVSTFIREVRPVVIQRGYDFLEVRLDLSSEMIKRAQAKDRFTNYYIEYKRSSGQHWINSTTLFLNDNSIIKINSLSFGTLYTIRAIFCRNNKNCYTGEYVNSIEESTKCDDIIISGINDYLNEEEDETTLVITIRENDKTCPKDHYSLYINGKKTPIDGTNITLNESPYKEIRISLTKTNGVLVNYTTHITTEGRSSEVENVSYESKETTILLMWQSPQKPNGHILGYNIKYQLNGLRGCKETLNVEDIKQYNETNLRTEITKLKHFARYKITITPVSATKMGHSRTIFVETLSSETATENIFNGSVVTGNLQTNEDSNMYVTLQWSLPTDCRQIEGQIYYDIIITAKSVWNNEIRNISVNDSTMHTIDKLAPFTNYTATVFTKRPEKAPNEKPALELNFITKSANPPAVPLFHTFGQSENALYLRWKPPSPPNGILENYLINVHCKGYREPKEYKIEANPTCKLWNEYLCYEIKNLMPNYNYEVKIKAKNFNTGYGKENSSAFLTKLQKPSQPENVTADFNVEDKYMTVFWKHPFSNSPVYNFICQFCEDTSDINNCTSLTYSVMSENSPNLIIQKNYSIKFSDAKYATNYKITIRGDNTNEGINTSFNFYTNPPKPKFKFDPLIELYSNATITISIPPLDPKYEKTTLLISTNAQNMAEDTEDYTKKIIEKYNITHFDLNNFRIAAEITPVNLPQHLGQNFTLGNLSATYPYNKPIMLIENMNITIICINTYQTKNSYSTYSLYKKPIIKEKKSGETNYELFALLILLLIPVVVFIFFQKKKNLKQKAAQGQNNLQVQEFSGVVKNSKDTSKSSKKHLASKTEIAKLKPRKDLPAYEIIDNNKVIIDEPNTSTTLIKISDLKEYVRKSLAQNELEKLHKSFPKGKTKPWEYGCKPENKFKNRYGNLIAYDESRVILNKLPNEPYSDYINANYIDGYRNRKAYIATQGPKEKTLNDFWRMVWQEKSKYIVMLCNVIENEKKKCEQYWPPINENKEFGEINVYHVNSQVYADYVCRTFKVKCEGESRTILQFHFISWPDHGIPLYPKSLVPLLKRIVVIPTEHPIIVHCSAGVGRTGTVLLCDICLRMAAHEGAVDIFKYQKKLREQRPNMVDNADQFRLVHLILIECLLIEPTSIICDDNLEYKINNLITSNGIKKQMDVINEFSWMDYVMRPNTSTNIIQTTKNRFENIVPDGFARVFLSRYPIDDEFSDYINAVHVDGFRQKDQFIVTQQPLPNTLGDFWRMIAEKGVHVIVSLNTFNIDDETLVPIYPENKSKFSPVPYLKLKLIDIVENDFYKVTSVVLFNTSTDNINETKEIINIIEIKDWSLECVVPIQKETDLIDLWENVNKMVKDKNPIVVTCYDGVTASGLFVTLAFVIEKIKLEQDCDVCLAVRTVRHNRQNFMTKMEQFEYIYRAAIIYVQSFQLYSNFKTNQK